METKKVKVIIFRCVAINISNVFIDFKWIYAAHNSLQFFVKLSRDARQ